jgi:hypothetical protein
MRGWQGQPCKMVEYEHWQKNKPSSRSPGCRLQFGGAEKSSSAITLQNSSTFSRHAVRAIQGAKCFGLKHEVFRRDARHLFLDEAARNNALALH